MVKVLLDVPLGATLKELREAQHYSQAELVRKAHLFGSNLSESAYSKIEQGIRNIYASDLVILKVILGFSYQEIFGEYEATVHQIDEQR